MLERFANVIYYLFCLIAGVTFFQNLNNFNWLETIITPLVVFGVGWVIRYILTGKESIKI